MNYVYEYLIFLAQAVTVVAAILIILSAIASVAARAAFGGDGPSGGHPVERPPRQPETRKSNRPVLPAGQFRKSAKAAAKSKKKEGPAEVAGAGRTKGAASSRSPSRAICRPAELRSFGMRINAILSQAGDGDEVIARVESPGGLVHGYGLAASQLLRIRERNLKLVVAVDKVAASGGYLMAAVANRVIAAPFAVVGSIGVVAQIPNVHRLLKKKDVDVEVITAGKYKRTLTVFGENTEEGRQKFIEDMEDLHTLFQEFVADKRPALDLDKVATGEAWYGQRAIDLNLVDEIMTSDEYLMNKCADSDVFEIRWTEPQKPLEKLLAQVESSVDRLAGLLFHRAG